MPDNTIRKGDTIEHVLIPGFGMTVRALATCQTDAARPEFHEQYEVIDPKGNEDWICGYDARLVRRGQS